MVKFKNFLTHLLLSAMMLSVLALPSGLSASAATDGEFEDVNSIHPNYQSIQYLKDEGIVVGYGDGTYGEAKNINRAEFLKIVMEASGKEAKGGNCYSDVKDEWFAPYVCGATEIGLVDGYPDGTFKPAQDINFAEASKIIVNAFGYETSAGDTWFEGYVKSLDGKDAIPYSISSFDKQITRADMAEMIWRLMTETTYKVSTSFDNIQQGKAVAGIGGELQTFESCTELHAYFEDNSSEYEDYYYDDYVLAEETSADDASEGEASPSAPSESKSISQDQEESSDEYSSTNVQVKGVDEADIVKNDGKYIYFVKGSTVRIFDAYPPESMKELDSITFDDDNFYPWEMYLDGDRLVVIGTSYASIYDDFGPMPVDVEESYYWGGWSSLSKVYIFDISDKSDVELLRHLSFEGDYNSSRKVDDTVYLVANQTNYYWPWEGDTWAEDDLVPLYGDSSTGEVETIVGCDQVKYIPEVIDTTNYIVVAAIPVDDPKAAIEEEVIMGSSGYGGIYASRDNLYISEPKYGWYYWDYESAQDEETIIHRFSLDETDISYTGVGSVPGTILNQFSMDEHEGHFRIATTLGNVWDGKSTNNLYVLDDEMEVVGELEGLAPGESIYSVRFMGDRAYIVTFKKVDPLFVIDVEDPTNPTVLGKLKIPGFSDYLHPYDENHLIGFGLDTADATEEELEDRGIDFAWYQGVKLAMFDVTDVENPKELHKLIIGDRGTSSPLSYNHKALLFDKEKGIMAFPILVAEISEELKNDPDTPANTYGDYVFQGAHIYDVSIEDGFELRGTISHYGETEVADNSGYWWWGVKDIERILYIGDYFYTISQSLLKASTMDDVEDVNELEIEGGDEEYYYYEY